MTGDCHVRICESLGVRFPRATRLFSFVIQNLTEYIHCTSKLFITIHKILKPGTLVLFLLIYIKNPPSQYSLYQTITIDFRLY